MEDICNNNSSAAHAALDDLGNESHANMTDLYWQAASSVAALARQNARLNQGGAFGEDEDFGNSHSCALPDCYQDSTDYNNQTLAYPEAKLEHSSSSMSDGSGKAGKRKERKPRNSNTQLLKLKKQSSNS